MFATLARATSLALSGIMAGIYVRDVISSPSVRRLPGPHYARYHQELDRDFARAMPVVGSVFLASALAAAAVPQERSRRVLSAFGLACGLGAVAVTAAREVPLNQQIQSWSPDAPPADWAETRDRWLAGHRLRTALGLVGLGCQIAAAVRR